MFYSPKHCKESFALPGSQRCIPETQIFYFKMNHRLNPISCCDLQQVGGGSLNCLEFGDSKLSPMEGCTGKKCPCPCQHSNETPETTDTGKVTRQLSPQSINTVVAFSVVSPEIKQAIESVKYIAENMRSRNKAKEVEDDWKYVAMVIDRIFLWVFVTVCVLGTLGLFLQPLCGFVS